MKKCLVKVTSEVSVSEKTTAFFDFLEIFSVVLPRALFLVFFLDLPVDGILEFLGTSNSSSPLALPFSRAET